MHEADMPPGDDEAAHRPPPGTASGPRERPPGMRPPGMPGRPGMPSRMGMAGPRDEDQLKDVLLLILTEGAGNDYDAGPVRELIEGKPMSALEPGYLQHVLDEASRLRTLPPQLGKFLEKIHAAIQGGQR